MTGDAAGIVDLINARRYGAALAALDGLPGAESPTRRRLRRQCLARMGRFAEAAAAGRAMLADPAATTDDAFRQAQILVECGLWEEAAAAALKGLDDAPGDLRFVAPLAQAALADPALAPLMTRGFSDGPAPVWTRPGQPVPGRIMSPQRLFFYSALDAAHPGSVGMLASLGDDWSVRMPTALSVDWPSAALVRRVAPLLDRLTAAAPTINRAAAARYVGQRLLTLLADDDAAALDFLPNAPMTLGQRHWVLWWDVLPVLFYPFLPFDAIRVDPRDNPYYAIVRAFLTSDRCVALITHYRLEDNPLLRLFPDPRIAAKLAFVSPSDTDAPLNGNRNAGPKTAARPDDRRRFRWLFTSSWNARDDDFYYRGGVDVASAFLTLAQEFDDIELILRSPLPASLSSRLRQAIDDHPRILWRPDRLSTEAFQALVDGSDLLVMPMAVLYRNGLVQAMKAGVAPVVADAMGVDDLVVDGATGCVVPGRGWLYAVGRDDGVLQQDFHSLLQAVDQPADPDFHRAFVDRLRGLLRDRAAVRRLGAAAMRDANQRWSRTEHAARFTRAMTGAMEKALDARRRSGPDNNVDDWLCWSS